MDSHDAFTILIRLSICVLSVLAKNTPHQAVGCPLAAQHKLMALAAEGQHVACPTVPISIWDCSRDPFRCLLSGWSKALVG